MNCHASTTMCNTTINTTTVALRANTLVAASQHRHVETSISRVQIASRCIPCGEYDTWHNPSTGMIWNIFAADMSTPGMGGMLLLFRTAVVKWAAIEDRSRLRYLNQRIWRKQSF